MPKRFKKLIFYIARLSALIMLVAGMLLSGWSPLPFGPSTQTAFATPPSIQGTSVCTNDTSSTSFTVNLPASIAAGELLLLFMSATTTSDITQSSGGFTEIDAASNGTAVRGEVWAKIAAGGDSDPVFTQSSNDDVAVVAMRVSAHSVSDVSTDIYKGTAATGTDANPDPPTLTPSPGARDYLWLAYHASDDDDDTTAVPTNFTQDILHCQSANSTSSSETSTAYRQLNTTNQDPGTFTIDATEEWVANTFAIRPFPAYTQAAFRFYEDGTESGSTAIDTENTDISRLINIDSNLHLRIRVDESNGGFGASTDDWQLQYSKNGGAYTNVTTSSSNVKSFNSTNLSDGATTTDRATNGISNGSGSFVAGEISEDGLIDDRELTSSNFTEHLYSLTVIAADTANGDTLDFRVQYNGATTAMTYSQTPTITISETSCSSTPSFPIASVLTNFTGSDEDPLNEGGSWSGPVISGTGQARRNNNAAIKSQSGTSPFSSYWATSLNANQEAFATVNSLPNVIGTQKGGLILRASTSNQNYYHFAIDGNSNMYIDYVTSGSTTTLASNTQSVSVGDSIGARAIGSTLTMYYKPAAGSWSQIISTTDSNITSSGFAGLGFSGVNTTGTFDDFAASSVSDSIDTNILLRGGNYFCNNTEQSFFWAS